MRAVENTRAEKRRQHRANAYRVDFVSEAIYEHDALTDEIERLHDVRFGLEVAERSRRWQRFMLSVRVDVVSAEEVPVSTRTFRVCRDDYDKYPDLLWARLLQLCEFRWWGRLTVEAAAPPTWTDINGYATPQTLYDSYSDNWPRTARDAMDHLRDFLGEEMLWMSDPQDLLQEALDGWQDSVRPFTWTFTIRQRLEPKRLPEPPRGAGAAHASVWPEQ
jgi:hypothetical protein